MAARKMIKKGCEAYLAYVLETKMGDIQVSNVPIVREFPDVFLDELPGVPPEREVEVWHDQMINVFSQVQECRSNK